MSGIGADPASPSLYVRKRGEGELAVTAAFPNATIVRPAVMFGADGGFVTTVLPLLRLPFYPMFGRGETRLQPVAVEDVAEAIARILERPQAEPRLYDFGGPRVFTYEEFLRTVMREAGLRDGASTGPVRRLAPAGAGRGSAAAPAGHAQSGGADGGRHHHDAGTPGPERSWNYAAARRRCGARACSRTIGAAMPKLDGVLETALYVDDLDRALRFYTDVLGLESLYRDTRMGAFSVGGKSVLLIFPRGGSLETVHMPGGTIPPHDGAGPLHIAFAIAKDELAGWETRLADNGIAIEGRTKWKRGGESIYFRDPDGHLLELATPGLWAIY